MIDENHQRYRVPDTNLNELKDTAAMLTMAGEYLCEEVSLKKIGSIIEKNREVLQNHVEDLRRQFVGRKDREDEPPVNDDLEQISHMASLLQKADSHTKQKFVAGEYGDELGAKIISLTQGINALKEKSEVEEVITYTKTESALGMFDRMKFITGAIAALLKFTFKIAALLILICLILFLYLFFTMEKEEGLSMKIRQDTAFLSSREADLYRIGEEIRAIQAEIKRIKKVRDRSSQLKIGLMDLNLKVYKLTEEREKAEQEISNRERDRAVSRIKLEEIKQKTFMERLLEPLFNLTEPLKKKWNEFFGT